MWLKFGLGYIYRIENINVDLRLKITLIIESVIYISKFK